MADTRVQSFYDNQYAGTAYAGTLQPTQHPYYPIVRQFIHDYQLTQKRCLEVGCGRGAFQDMVGDYTGIDVSAHVALHLHKPFVQADVTSLPFDDNAFDAVWSITVLEHVLQPEVALKEICRITRPGGFVLMAPAWHTRAWFAEGYPVRSFAELPWRGRLIKASIPLREFWLYRYGKVVLRRLTHLAIYSRRATEIPLRYGRLEANYDKFWMSDSDACNSLDPFDFILWFESRGHPCLSHVGAVRRLFARDLGLVFRINKQPR